MVKSLRSSYTGLYPQKERVPAPPSREAETDPWVRIGPRPPFPPAPPPCLQSPHRVAPDPPCPSPTAGQGSWTRRVETRVSWADVLERVGCRSADETGWSRDHAAGRLCGMETQAPSSPEHPAHPSSPPASRLSPPPPACRLSPLSPASRLSPPPTPSPGRQTLFREKIFIELMTSDRKFKASSQRGLQMKDLRDPKNLTIQDVKL